MWKEESPEKHKQNLNQNTLEEYSKQAEEKKPPK